MLVSAAEDEEDEMLVGSEMVSEDEVDRAVPELLGHGIDLRWSGDLDNRAVDVLGNLLGATNTRMLRMVTDQQLLADRAACPRLYIDDTSLVLGFLTQLGSC